MVMFFACGDLLEVVLHQKWDIWVTYVYKTIVPFFQQRVILLDGVMVFTVKEKRKLEFGNFIKLI